MTSIKLSENGGKAPEAVPYMPAGLNEICCTVNGRAGKRTVMVDAAACERLNADLQEQIKAHQSGGRARPVILFDHKAGAAAAVPTGFEWDEKRGILLRVEWTQAGRTAVEGGNYAYISPAFKLAPQSESITGLQDGVEVGSLVNDPAFTRNECIAAAREVVEDVQVWAANPYGCNQYGHEFKAPHGEGWKPRGQSRDSGKETKTEDNIDKEVDDYLKGTEDERWVKLRQWDAGVRKAKDEALDIRESTAYRKGDPEAIKRYNEAKEKANAAAQRRRSIVKKAGEKRGYSGKKLDTLLRHFPETVLSSRDEEEKQELEFELVCAENPYGCNQYGHGFREPHNEAGGKGQKTFDFFGETKDKRRAKDIAEVDNATKAFREAEKEEEEAYKKYEKTEYGTTEEKEAESKWKKANQELRIKTENARKVRDEARKKGYELKESDDDDIEKILDAYDRYDKYGKEDIQSSSNLTPFCNVEKNAKEGDNIRAANNGSERTTENSDMETVKKQLGLGADATPADVAAAIAALKKKSEAGQKRIEEVEAECNEHKKALQEHKEKAADGFVDRLRKGGKVSPQDEDTLKAAREMYIDNPERTERIYAAMQPICPTVGADDVQAGRVPQSGGDYANMSLADFYAKEDF